MEAESMSRRSLVASQTFGCCLGKEYIVELHEKSLSGSIRKEGREIRTPNLLIWSQTCYRCAILPVTDLGMRLDNGLLALALQGYGDMKFA